MDVLRAVADRSGGRASWWAPTLDAAERAARARAVEGGILVTIGAGDITKVSDRLTSKDAADG
jgi:UDP-N-acetylmuramate-alanine ligase